MQTEPPTWHAEPSKPAYVPPPGAVDAHCHVFGPAARFPFAPERKYTPTDAPKEQLFALRRHLGLARNVLVQASCHGRDNAAVLDAILADPEKCRGIAVLDPETPDAELDRLHEGGIRGVRFSFVRRLVNPDPPDVSARLAARIAERGWHTVIYMEAADLQELEPFLRSLPGTVVIDHMGRPDVGAGPEGEMFGRFLALIEDEKFWTKVTGAERLTVDGPPYDDVAPFARRIVEAVPDRVLWGTDWPHPNMKSHRPDDGVLVDRIPVIAETETLRRKLLVDNPMRLYWPE